MQRQQGSSSPTSDMSNATFTVAQHASFANTAPIPPLVADMRVRKSISDSCLQRGLPASYHNMNMNYMLISRSGGRTVKEIIRTINERSDQHLGGTSVEPPTDEINILAHFAPDAYYRVVISGKQGLQAITRAMCAFPNCRELQECGCLTLGNLCTQNNNLVVADQAGAVQAVIAAMRSHPCSVAVQSAACEALRNMSSLILAYSHAATSPIASELMTALSKTSSVCLFPVHREIADALMQLIQQAVNRM
eukprot:scaffold768_cov166-Amphora_coffeaeformis.AAC.23